MRAWARWALLVIVAVTVGAWSGRVVGAPTTPVAQSSGTSSSGSGSSGGSGSDGSSGSTGGSSSGGGGSDGSGGGTGSGSDGSGGTGSGGSGSDGGGTDSGGSGGTGSGGGEGSGGGSDGSTASPTTAAPDVPEEHIAAAKPDEGSSCDRGQRCYTVEQADAVEAARLPDGTVIALGDAPVVNVDSGASTSASSNVDLRVDVDVDTGDVVRVERRIDPVRQFALITIAALLGVFVGAAVLGTFLRFRNGPRR